MYRRVLFAGTGVASSIAVVYARGQESVRHQSVASFNSDVNPTAEFVAPSERPIPEQTRVQEDQLSDRSQRAVEGMKARRASDIVGRMSPENKQVLASAIKSGYTSPVVDHVVDAAGARTNVDTTPLPRVVVIGGGVAGIAAAQRLERARCEVFVVDAKDYLEWSPLVPHTFLRFTSMLGLSGRVYHYRAIPFSSILSRSRVVVGEVAVVQPSSILFTDGSQMPFDAAVVCLGGRGSTPLVPPLPSEVGARPRAPVVSPPLSSSAPGDVIVGPSPATQAALSAASTARSAAGVASRPAPFAIPPSGVSRVVDLSAPSATATPPPEFPPFGEYRITAQLAHRVRALSDLSVAATAADQVVVVGGSDAGIAASGALAVGVRAPLGAREQLLSAPACALRQAIVGRQAPQGATGALAVHPPARSWLFGRRDGRPFPHVSDDASTRRDAESSRPSSVVLLESGGKVLGADAPFVQQWAADNLAAAGVDVVTAVADVAAAVSGVVSAVAKLASHTGIVDATTSVAVPPAVAVLPAGEPVRDTRRFLDPALWDCVDPATATLRVDEQMRVLGLPHIFAAGSCARQTPRFDWPAGSALLAVSAANNIANILNGFALNPIKKSSVKGGRHRLLRCGDEVAHFISPKYGYKGTVGRKRKFDIYERNMWGGYRPTARATEPVGKGAAMRYLNLVRYKPSSQSYINTGFYELLYLSLLLQVVLTPVYGSFCCRTYEIAPSGKCMGARGRYSDLFLPSKVIAISSLSAPFLPGIHQCVDFRSTFNCASLSCARSSTVHGIQNVSFR